MYQIYCYFNIIEENSLEKIIIMWFTEQQKIQFLSDFLLPIWSPKNHFKIKYNTAELICV
jgi:hypothetical protein